MRISPKELTRREFLMFSGTAIAALAAGCGRRTAQSTIRTLQPLPTISPQAVPTFLPPTRPPTPEGVADMILKNGHAYTLDATDSIAQAIAVKDGLILAVGQDDVIGAMAGESTQVIDLGGQSVTPGLIDPHVHFWSIGMIGPFYAPFFPPEVTTIAELQTRLKESLSVKTKGEWLVGFYQVFKDGKLPDRHDLDKVSPENPVFIMHQGGHYGSANSLALQMAGITADTPSPPGGIIEKDSKGEPTGIFYNHRAMDMLRRVIPKYTKEMIMDSLMSTQALMAGYGVTSFQDNNVRDPDALSVYQQAAKEGKMYMRSVLYKTMEWPSDLEWVNKIEYYSDDYSRVGGFKFLIDGQASTAYTHEPHEGASWDMPTWDPKQFKEAIRVLHETGLQICVHCAGDAAVDLTLDAYEEAMNAYPRPDPRHRLEHAVMTTPESTQRIKDLGVVIQANPTFIRISGDRWKDGFSKKQMERIMVTREWLEAGIPLAIGSDAPTVPWYRPQDTMSEAIMRLTISDQVLLPDQVMTSLEALRAHTIGAAYAAHEENIKGTIEPGKLADFVVWNGDPLAVEAEDMYNMQLAMTIVGGKVVYQD